MLQGLLNKVKQPRVPQWPFNIIHTIWRLPDLAHAVELQPWLHWIWHVGDLRRSRTQYQVIELGRVAGNMNTKLGMICRKEFREIVVKDDDQFNDTPIYLARGWVKMDNWLEQFSEIE